MMQHSEYSCRSCGSPKLHPVLSIGPVPLANSLVSEDRLSLPQPRYPLDLAVCTDCSLVQLLETVPPEKLFSEYFYFSSFSNAFLQHAREITEELCASLGLGHKNLVIEIASNDGYLLQYFKQKGIPVLGIEPAKNVASVAWDKRGIRTLCRFFTRELAREIAGRGERADVIIANNVLAHVPDLNGFVAGIGVLLKEEGVAWIEVPCLLDMVTGCEFDTIYHEHCCYFSATALDRLFERHGLVIEEVRKIPFHGGSLCLLVRNGGPSYKSEALKELIMEEQEWGVNLPASYNQLGCRVFELKEKLTKLLQEVRLSGKRVAAYGAAAKGTMLLNIFNIKREMVEFVVDRSPYKQGRYIPGTLQPVVAPSVLETEKPDFLLLLAWNFADEIIAQQQEYKHRGGHFIIPIPELKIV